MMLRRLDDLAAEGVDFALETTLSGVWLRPHILEWQRMGYMVKLYYIRFSNADLSVARVRNRVENGGHNIPEPIVRRRF